MKPRLRPRHGRERIKLIIGTGVTVACVATLYVVAPHRDGYALTTFVAAWVVILARLIMMSSQER
jgi:drug/metabolite transporter (DMT)-like permease